MKIIDRYLLRTFLVPFFYCLTAFMMMYVIFDLFDNLNDFVEGQTPLLLVVKYYLILFPSVLIRIVPISLLLAVLYSLSTLTKNNELTAMRASGISILRLMVPFLAVGFLFTVVVGIVHETVSPRAAYWCFNFVREQKRNDPAAVYIKTRPGHQTPGHPPHLAGGRIRHPRLPHEADRGHPAARRHLGRQERSGPRRRSGWMGAGGFATWWNRSMTRTATPWARPASPSPRRWRN
jgi:hypothetical protein